MADAWSEEEVDRTIDAYFSFGTTRTGFYVLPGSLTDSASLRPESYQGLPGAS